MQVQMLHYLFIYCDDDDDDDDNDDDNDDNDDDDDDDDENGDDVKVVSRECNQNFVIHRKEASWKWHRTAGRGSK